MPRVRAPPPNWAVGLVLAAVALFCRRVSCEPSSPDDRADDAAIARAVEGLPAGARKLALGSEVDLESRFVWRGLAESRSAALQPSAHASLYGFTASVWGSLTLVYEPPHGRFALSALEPSASYSIALGGFRFEPAASYRYWASDEAPRSTTEAALATSYHVGAVRLVSVHNVDLQAHPGAYFGTFGVGYTRTRHRWTVQASIDLGWATSTYNQAYFARSLTTIDLVDARVLARYDLTDIFYLALHVAASSLVALELQRSVQEPTLVVGGIAVGAGY